MAAYSGQTETGEREALESDLAAGRVKALVATSALGMGFDATLGFVVNVGAPSSPVAYYQQVGRAGRGTDKAQVVLLPALEDRDIWKYFASLAFPPEGQVRQVLSVLDGAERPLGTPSLETYVDLGRSRLEMMLKVLDVDGAVQRVQGGWQSTGRAWDYDQDRYDRVRQAREREQQAMLDYLSTDGCRMLFLRDQLDDPDAQACGRCDNCGGMTVSAEVSTQAQDAAHERLARPGVVVEPRKMWPTALTNLGIDLKGKIAEPPSAGRAVARLTDLGYGQQLRDLFREGTPDGPVPVPLVKAVIEVLGDWKPRADGDRLRRVRAPDDADQRLRRRALALPPDPGGRPVRDRRPRGRAGPGCRELRPAGGRGAAPLPARGRPARGSGAAARRPGRHRLDAHRRLPGAARGRRDRRTPADAGHRELGSGASSSPRRSRARSRGTRVPRWPEISGKREASTSHSTLRKSCLMARSPSSRVLRCGQRPRTPPPLTPAPSSSIALP